MSGFSKWLIGILVLSAVLRITYYATGELIPVIWDARRHAAGALGVISYLEPPKEQLTAPEGEERNRQDRYRFKYYYDKYVQGEPIVWAPYSPPTLTEARDALFFTGPLYPSLLAAVFFVAPGADISIVRFIGVIFDILSNLLLILIAVRLIGRKGALLAGFFYAIYFPFIQTSTMLLLETSTSFWMLLALFLLLKGDESTRTKHFIWAGVACGLLILNKPTAIFLFVPLGIGYYAYASREIISRIIVRRLAYFILPIAIALIGWTTVASLKYGQFTLRQPGYAEANLRQSTSTRFEGYDLDWVADNFWKRSVSGDILADPVGFAGLMVKKLERLWSRPYNDYRKTFIFPQVVSERFHLFLVISGLFGLIWLWLSRWRYAVWPILIVGYYTTIHTIFHSVSRYQFNAIPMLVMVSGGLLVAFYEWYLKDKEQTLIHLLPSFVLIVVGLGLSDRWLANNWTQAVSIEIIKTVCIITGAFLIGRLFLRQLKNKWSILLTVTVALIVPLAASMKSLARDAWAEFDLTLDRPDMKAGTQMFISRLDQPKEDEFLAVLIDLNSAPGRRNTFTVTIGDKEFEYVQGEQPLMKYFYPKSSYKIFSQIIPYAIESYRQWAIIPVAYDEIVEELQKNGKLDVSVAINSRFPEKNNVVYLHGNKDGINKDHYIPEVRYTSIERFVHRNDPRIRFEAETFSDSTKSYYIARNDSPGTTSPGGQQGRYNIYLFYFTNDGKYIVY